MSRPDSTFVCSGCGEALDADALPFRCSNVRPGDDVDHVLVRELDEIAFPDPADDEPNPFLRYRGLFHARSFGRARGLSDEELDDLVRRLDAAVARVDGGGFRVTPVRRSAALSSELRFTSAGGVLVKDETANVARSHKARHLFGVLHFLDVRERLGLGPDPAAPLAIASCGNAAWAATVLAEAKRRPLDVFVPPGADDWMVARMRDHGARVTECMRGDIPGDPAVRRFRAAVEHGAVPFTVQGSENGLAIEGGHTVAWEMVTWLAKEGRSLDRLFVQVGGGALASACIAAFREARRAGLVESLPRIHPVQTESGHPLQRAHELVIDDIYQRAGDTRPPTAVAAGALQRRFSDPEVTDALRRAATQRSRYMWPWESPPTSIARGILDDETYDWHAVVSGMLESGGWPLVVDDRTIAHAQDLGSKESPVGFTGAAGLAGLVQLADGGSIGAEETVAVLFTGERRGRG